MALRWALAHKSPRDKWATVVAVTALALALVLATAVLIREGYSRGRASSHASTSAWPKFPYFGVFEPGESESYRSVASFGKAVGRQPNLVLYYQNIPEQFPSHLAAEIHAHGATPLAQIDPGHASMDAIAKGRYDEYLRSYARAVRAYGHKIVISFAAEMNGNWYAWGWHHTSPMTWISAWRHVVDVFRAQGADQVIWLWTGNIPSPATAPFENWWPGSSYVDWVGIDGYYFAPSQTFSNAFEPMIAEVKMLTDKPILLSETAVGPVVGVQKIFDLFAGIGRNHLLGLVYFDEAQHNPPYQLDWRLENHPSFLAAFRRAIAMSHEGLFRGGFIADFSIEARAYTKNDLPSRKDFVYYAAFRYASAYRWNAAIAAGLVIRQSTLSIELNHMNPSSL